MKSVRPKAVPREQVEIRVFAGRLEVNDREGTGLASRLVRVLEDLGVRTGRRFESPCG
ncbi:MAG: hypothetical protein RDU89_09880 [bacterium]|nr:hypothetical protein [bacterium]